MNPLNRDYVVVYGRKQCHVLNFDLKAKHASRISLDLSLDALSSAAGVSVTKCLP